MYCKKTFKVRKLTELNDACEIYIDAIFPQVYAEVLELLEKGTKIHVLRSPSLVKKFRDKNGAKKSYDSDAIILAKIPRIHFKELTLKELNLLRFINIYEKCAEWKRIIKQWTNIYSLDPLEKCAKGLRSIHNYYGHRIIEEIMRNENYATMYRMVCEELELKDSVEVAILVARLPLNWKLSRLKGLLGLTPCGNRSYNHKLRRHLANLAVTIYLNNRQHGIGTKLFEDINPIPRDKALYTLQLRILKILKKAWQQQRLCLLAGGQ